MADSYYQPGSKRADRVRELFASIAPRYDRINAIQSFGMHRRWKRKLVRLAQIQPGDPALDLCCGTGDITELLATAGARATGLDFTGEMLEVARQRQKNLPPETNLQYVQGDAMNLPFEDNTFEVVTVGFGLRNLAEWRKGLDEMHRVARPGGRLLVLDFGKPDHGLWRSLYFGYLRLIVPVYGKLFCGNWSAYAYILESLTAYPAQRGVESAMKELGCRETRTLNMMGGAMSINIGVTS